jgi:hypothetical protein
MVLTSEIKHWPLIAKITLKALANFSPGLELATTLGSKQYELSNAESVRQDAYHCERFQR